MADIEINICNTNSKIAVHAMNNPSEKLVLGAKMMTEFLGEDLLDDLRKHTRDDLPSQVSNEYIAEVCFSSYARPALQFRERCLMNLGILVALNRPDELAIHIRAALHNGLSREQICEACRHAMVYCGVPAGRDALCVAGQVFNGVDARQKTESAKLA